MRVVFCFSSLPCPMFDSPPACLVPGAGLGRLALEISSLGMHMTSNCYELYYSIFFSSVLTVSLMTKTGFISQGNEFSYYMMICSSFILNQ